MIRKVTPAGVETTLAGSADSSQPMTDGTGAAARFDFPTVITIDTAGNLYVAHDATVRKVTPTGVVTTIVGAPGQSGFLPGPLPGVVGPPSGLAISGTSLYITTNHGVAVVTNVP